MAQKPVRNIAASVRDRLLRIARESGRDFDAVLLQYFQERFLYRLAQSPYRRHLILKGALLFLAYDMSLLRPTRDIDFLGTSTSNDLEEIRGLIAAIARLEFADGVVFFPETIQTERITEDADYAGIRVKIEARLTAARKVLQLDIGFGDVVVAGPVAMDFPVLLEDQASPNLLVYSRESAIAEKFEALVSLSLLTSRMKDIYDILHLAEREAFSQETLREAVQATFARRSTPLNDRRVVFSDRFTADQDKSVQWEVFLRRSRLTSDLTLPAAMARLEAFIEPVCSERPDAAEWNPAAWRWEGRP
ncbi:MAG: nucleotidyl transferase AbiEii/AbiGii toxin family protein [Trichloromonas sp.]|jgi:predicted nucleotidyltransferase component of viral defense system|nr:nucleotidyl transferase AbiEii/AbiGii toxin family protein [Trichloromonas sp.]